MSDFLPVRKACELVGGLSALAKLLGVAPPIVHRWAANERPVPHLRCVQIEQLTNGEVTRQMLRPDDFHEMWPELTDKKHQHKT